MRYNLLNEKKKNPKTWAIFMLFCSTTAFKIGVDMQRLWDAKINFECIIVFTEYGWPILFCYKICMRGVKKSQNFLFFTKTSFLYDNNLLLIRELSFILNSSQNTTSKVQRTFLFATVNKNTPCNSDDNFLLLWSLLTWQLSYLFRTVSDHWPRP